ncbi:MAG: type II secretion system secretin GspD [Hyphomonadaceae bacterium]
MKRRRSLSLAAAFGFATFAAASPGVQAQEVTRTTNGAVSLREVDIRAFIEDVSNATGRTFIVDPRVSGRVSVVAHQSLSERELFDVFMSTLRVNGFVAQPTANGAYRIIPDAVAAREPAPRNAGPSDHRYVSQVIQLQFADAEAVANAIRPMLSERGQATVNRRGNYLVVVDYGSTITRLREVVSTLDRDNSTIRSLRLRNTSAAEMARVAQNLATAIGEDAGARSLVQAVAVGSSNTLLLRGDSETLDQLVPVIQELEAQADFQSGVQVITLRYAVAEDLVPVLQQIAASLNAPAGDGASTAPGRRANIAHHRATNSLIISADPETQEALSRVVRSLDVRRQQILVEAIIVEVSDAAARELGLQFLAAGDGSNAVPFLSTSYANTAPNLLAVTGALLADGDGDDNPALADLRRAAVNSLIGASGVVAGIGGTTNDGSTILGLILNALAEDRDSNVLSTPSVMTLDNETASILVGQQIPVTTGEALSDNNENPFRTIRREDVGVQLEVRPQISEGGAIRLAIRQEVSSIFGPVVEDSADLITNRRAIETVVQVDAGEVIVLGGLIQEDVQRNNSGIPGLRSIPLAGRLFRSEGQTRRRTNLMVFLRPTVVSTPEQARAVTQRQYQNFRGTDGLDRGIGARLDRELQSSFSTPNNLPAVAPRPDQTAQNAQTAQTAQAAPARLAPPSESGSERDAPIRTRTSVER